MRTELSGVPVDVVRAEASRFRHPLLLVHGLWTGGWIWRGFSAYLAHRGWDVWIPSLLDTEGGPLDLARRSRALVAVCRELPAAPVVVTHDAGLALADVLAAELALPAIVAIAPLVLSPTMVWRRPRWWSARVGVRPLSPPGPSDAEPLLLGLLDDDVRRLRPDSGALLRGVSVRSLTRGWHAMPGVIVAVDGDRAVALSDCRHVARVRGWELEVHDDPGRFPMLGASAPRLADRVHRWLVRALGADLLAWLEEEGAG